MYAIARGLDTQHAGVGEEADERRVNPSSPFQRFRPYGVQNSARKKNNSNSHRHGRKGTKRETKSFQ